MPQGGHRTDSLIDVPETKGYNRKKVINTAGPKILPKSTKSSKNVNMNFIHSLSTMTRNAEMIAAGKFVRSGKTLTTPSLQQQATKQLEMDRKAGEKVGRTYIYSLDEVYLGLNCVVHMLNSLESF
jgi:hypothetical protein